MTKNLSAQHRPNFSAHNRRYFLNGGLKIMGCFLREYECSPVNSNSADPILLKDFGPACLLISRLSNQTEPSEFVFCSPPPCLTLPPHSLTLTWALPFRANFETGLSGPIAELGLIWCGARHEPIGNQ